MRYLFLCLLISAFVIPVYCHGNTNIYFFEDIRILNSTASLRSTATLLYEKNKFRYSVKNLFDSDLKTAWVSSTNFSTNYGFYHLEIEFDDPVYLKNIEFWNGYQKSHKLFEMNDRAKEVGIITRVDGNDEYFTLLDFEYELDDKRSAQIITPDLLLPFKLKNMRIIFYLNYQGTKWNDLCISEIKLNITKENPYEPTISYPKMMNLIIKSVKYHQDLKSAGWDWHPEILDIYENSKEVDRYWKSKIHTINYDFFYYTITKGGGLTKLYRTFKRGSFVPGNSPYFNNWLKYTHYPAMKKILENKTNSSYIDEYSPNNLK